MKLKDIYDSVKEGKKIKRLKETGDYINNEEKIIQLNEEPVISELDLITENVITRWIDKFFDKVKNRQAQEMIRDMYYKHPDLGKEMEKIRQSVNKINSILLSKKKFSDEEIERILKF